MIDIPVILTAKELLDFFNPTNAIWSNQKYLFRAQYEEDINGRKLIPSIFRPIQLESYFEFKFKEAESYLMGSGSREEVFAFNWLNSKPISRNCIILNTTEKFILKEFVERTNKIGMHVPESEKILNWVPSINDLMNEPELNDVRRIEYQSGQPYSINIFKKLGESSYNRPPLFAGLAQHHGCPTRLLDFSFNPYKALFHTINSEIIPDNGFITLYFVPENLFDRRWITEHINRYKPEGYDSIYQLIKMPSSHNHYLYQQEGLFAYPIAPFDHYLRTNEYPSVDSFAEMMSSNNPANNQLRKVSIPVTEFNELKKLLRRFNITLSSMMPNLDNVVKEMKADAK